MKRERQKTKFSLMPLKIQILRSCLQRVRPLFQKNKLRYQTSAKDDLLIFQVKGTAKKITGKKRKRLEKYIVSIFVFCFLKSVRKINCAKRKLQHL